MKEIVKQWENGILTSEEAMQQLSAFYKRVDEAKKDKKKRVSDSSSFLAMSKEILAARMERRY